MEAGTNQSKIVGHSARLSRAPTRPPWAQAQSTASPKEAGPHGRQRGTTTGESCAIVQVDTTTETRRDGVDRNGEAAWQSVAGD